MDVNAATVAVSEDCDLEQLREAFQPLADHFEQQERRLVPVSVTPELHSLAPTEDGTQWMALFDLSDGRTAIAVLRYCD
jgi:hypothetical protein